VLNIVHLYPELIALSFELVVHPAGLNLDAVP
jgi:hypothetical protein